MPVCISDYINANTIAYMLKAKHHFIIYPLFKVLTKLLIKINFKKVYIIGDFIDNGRPVLVLANHISWWDGFWVIYLNLKKIRRKFHFMILEQQLRKHWYFQYTGGYSVRKNSRAMIESLDYSNAILANNRNMLFMFPQGEIHSSYDDRFKFGAGAQRIISRCDDEVVIVFVSNMYDYFSDSKLNLYTYIKSFQAKQLKGVDLEVSYNSFYINCLKEQKAKKI